MIIMQPATTGLIVLGASKFKHHPDLNRNAFRISHDGIIEYFRSTGLFYIPEEKICNVFDLEVDKNRILAKINGFLTENIFTDLFVYICSHGFEHDHDLRIFTAESKDENLNPFYSVELLTFNEIIGLIEIMQKCRTYCIVDCCYSGKIHEKGGRENTMQDTDTDVFPKSAVFPESATTILTANNQGRLGGVVAVDGLKSIESTMFTHALLDCLKNGKKEHEADGFSFKELQCFINEKLDNEIIDKLNSERGDDCPIVSDQQRGSCMPEFSDRKHPQAQMTTALSRARIFPNKGSKYKNAIDAALLIRTNAHTIRVQSEHIGDLEDQLNNLKSDMESWMLQFESKNREYRKTADLNADLNEEINGLKIVVGDLQSENQNLKNRAVTVHKGILERIREREELNARNNINELTIQDHELTIQNHELTIRKYKTYRNRVKRNAIALGVLSIVVFIAYVFYFEPDYSEIVHYIGSWGPWE